MFTTNRLKGNWGTLLLPVNQDNSIDYDRLNDEISILIDAKVDGIYSNGTAGELHNQTEREFDKISQLLAEKCNKASIPFQIGASHPSPVISLERVERTVSLRPTAYQVIFPEWEGIKSFEEQFIFLQKIAEQAKDTPLVLYNPPHAKVVLSPEEFKKLAKAVPQLVGIKVVQSGEHWFADMRKYAADLSVFVPGHWLATGIKEKVAAGAFSNVACLSPKGSQWWWQLMNKDIDGALDVERRIHRFFAEHIDPFKKMGYSNPALDKFLAAIGGWASVGTRLRWPYRWIPGGEVLAARKSAQQMLPEFF